jgi:hypothetical protein
MRGHAMSGSGKFVEAIRAIEAHVARYPLAADSADGVARSWLVANGVTASQREVELALETLVRQGTLRRVQLADGSTLYCGAAHG